MIPRKIHYCWLSGQEMPEPLRRCMATWREVMPDYELVKWDAARFDFSASAFALEAYRARNWAFASDYIRVHALHAEGGIYLDTDVAVRKRFDELLGYEVFTAVEYHPKVVRQYGTLALLHADGSSRTPQTRKPGIGLQAAAIGGVRGHPFFAECLEYYRHRRFIRPEDPGFDGVISPDAYAMVAERYGFRYRDERQLLRGNMLIAPSEVFAGSAEQESSKSYAVHYCAGGWRTPAPGVVRRAAKSLSRMWG